jgi:transposase-like protein
MQSSNGQLLPQQEDPLLPVPSSNPETAQGFTAERVLRTRPKTYRAIVQLLADTHASVSQIAKFHRVSTHTVRAIRHRESQTIAERKKTLVALLANVAELGAERMEEKIGKASLRDATIGTGIAIDKLLAITGQIPPAVGFVIMPSEQEREEMRAMDAKLTSAPSAISFLNALRSRVVKT